MNFKDFLNTINIGNKFKYIKFGEEKEYFIKGFYGPDYYYYSKSLKFITNVIKKSNLRSIYGGVITDTGDRLHFDSFSPDGKIWSRQK